MKDKVEASLTHFIIYLEVVFGSVVWNVFTDEYRLRIANFWYCSLKKCAIETTAKPDSYVSSSIATNDSTANINQFFSDCRIFHDFDEFPNEIQFDLSHQVTLIIGTDIYGILSDFNDDYTTTTKTDCFAATLHSIKSNIPILTNYLPPPK